MTDPLPLTYIKAMPGYLYHIDTLAFNDELSAHAWRDLHMRRQKMDQKVVAGLAAALLAGVMGASMAADEMITIPAGKFLFGEEKQETSLPTYQIDKYEVTNAQYAKVKAGFEYHPEMGQFPVVWVTQIDAFEYCEAVGKRLPTVQEWEKAARGEDGRLYPWGNEFNKEFAVTSETAPQGIPEPVGSRKQGQSPYGVMDMAGNVWEWTSSSRKGDTSYIILKGGSFFENRRFATTTYSLGSIPDDSKQYIGFRCVKDAK